mmetsp:Transcript_34445/g.56302  ORF Transcript_34445/g.56302 Transcript_34445/m.56302 type:complete len:300 (-) Transcript_34445:204-1103(-)
MVMQLFPSLATNHPLHQKKSAHQNSYVASLLLPLPTKPPRLDAIPERIEDLLKVINIGGCPHCGSIEMKKYGKVKLRGCLVQRYLCKACSKAFRELTEKADAHRTFEGRQKLQALFHYAYGELVKKEMTADELDFERKMTSLQDQLRAKRRNISKLLGIPLDEDCVDNDQTARVDNGGSNLTKGASQAKNPFRETILLLRHETPKLERAVTRMLIHHRDHSSISPSSIMEVEGGITNHYSDTQQQLMAEEEELDVVNDQPPNSVSKCNESYKLASRIMQEGGEEIEIFEKCTGDDRHGL